MFLTQEGHDAMPNGDYAGGSQMRRTTSNNTQNGGAKGANLRRMESIGKGDPRRSSRYHPNNRASRIPSMMVPEEEAFETVATSPRGYREGLPNLGGQGLLPTAGWDNGRRSPYGGSSNGSSSPLGPLGPNDPMLSLQQQQQQLHQHMNGGRGGGVRMTPYGAGFGAPMPRPGMATTQMSSPSSFAPAAPLGAGLGRGMEASSHAASRQIL